MKVKELIGLLQKFDSNLDVLCWSEDENLLGKDRGFILLDIEYVDLTEGEKDRLKDGSPIIRLGKSENSQKHVTLSVTSEF